MIWLLVAAFTHIICGLIVLFFGVNKHSPAVGLAMLCFGLALTMIMLRYRQRRGSW